MDETQFYYEVRSKLESFIRDAFNSDVVISPRTIYFVDEIKGPASGFYDPSSDAIVVEKAHLKDALPHELLHHVGYTSNEFIFEPLRDDEYWTEILSIAFLKYTGLDENPRDEIEIYLYDDGDPYKKARIDSIGKSWEDLVEMYKNEVYETPISVSIEI